MRPRRFLLSRCYSFVFAGCESDHLLIETAPDLPRAEADVSGLRLYHLASGEATPFVCETEVFRAGAPDVRVAQDRVALYFAPGVIEAARGQTERVTYRLQTPEGVTLRRAVCTVPATEEAKSLLQRKLLLAHTFAASAAQAGKHAPKNGLAPLALSVRFEADACDNGLCWQERLDATVVAQVDSLTAITAGDKCGPGPNDDKSPDDDAPGGGGPDYGGGPPPNGDPDEPEEPDDPVVVRAEPVSPSTTDAALMMSEARSLASVFDPPGAITEACPGDAPEPGPAKPCETEACEPEPCEEVDGECVPDPLHRRLAKAEVEKKFKKCGYTNSKTLGDAFSANARVALGLGYRPEDKDQEELDGYETKDYKDAKDVIIRIMEAKFSDRFPVISFSQSKKHIDELAEVYDKLRPGIKIWSPMYVIVSISSRDYDKLDHDNRLGCMDK